jgi:hypothetical protein
MESILMGLEGAGLGTGNRDISDHVKIQVTGCGSLRNLYWEYLLDWVLSVSLLQSESILMHHPCSLNQ